MRIQFPILLPAQGRRSQRRTARDRRSSQWIFAAGWLAPALLGFCLASLPAASAAPAELPVIDLAHAPASGVRVLDGYAAVPRDGILETWRVELPEYLRGCYFSTNHGPEPGGGNGVEPWMFGRELERLFRPGRGYRQNPAVWRASRLGIFALFDLPSGDVLAVLPMAGPETVSWLEVDQTGRVMLRLGTFGTAAVNTNAPLVAWARGRDAYAATRKAWAAALSCAAVDHRTAWRDTKTYPEPFRYLGWCSWEQYKKTITSDLLVRAVKDLEHSEIPVRWVLVDDGHQQTAKGGAKGKDGLASFEPNRTKFPDGWRPLMATRRPDQVRWFGLWNAFLGLWGDISPRNDFGPEVNAHLMTGTTGNLVPKDDPRSEAVFYNALIAAVKRHGFDFAKIDAQTFVLRQYAGAANPVQASVGNSQALEHAVHADLQGLINCMAQNPLCVFNTRYSVVTRCSKDYILGNASAAKSHLLQSFANTLWLGQTVWPDPDMFHSSDPVCGQMMAVSKALSGGPVYLSDAPKELVAQYIMPLCYKNGELLRPLAPAVPLPDSVFANAFHDRRAYRVIAPLANGAAAVGLYNLDAGKVPVSEQATVTAADYRDASAMMQPWPGRWKVPAEGLVIYDWFAGRGEKLSGTWSTTLRGLADRLVLLTPIRDGWSVIGRADKYLAPAAVETWSATPATLSVTLRESGPLLVYSVIRPVSDRGTVKAAPGEHLWRVDLPVGPRNVRLTLRR